MSKEVERLRQLKALALDLDDTGVRSGNRIKVYHQQVLGELAVSPMPSQEKIDRLVGGPSDLVYPGLYPSNKIEDAKKIFAKIAGSDSNPSRPIPGVPEALRRLPDMGVLYGWATNRKRQTELAITSGGHKVSDAAFIRDGNSGPKNEALKDILRMLRKMGIQAVNLAMVGDTARDMHDAHEADPQILKIGIWEFAADPDALIDASDLAFYRLPQLVDVMEEAKTITH